VELHEDAARHLATMADGDVRKALTALEMAVLTTPAMEDGRIRIDMEVAVESVQKKAVVYDGDGDAHYDTASAFIKSIRGGDPDAALYWLAKMLHAGEDPRFIARRLVISASEDIGMADSNGLRVAIAAQQALDFVGLPEARINLAHATVYLATAPKSNRAYAGLEAALADVRQGRTLAVPPHLRTKSRKKLARGSGIAGADEEYQYSHDSEEGYVPQAYLLEGKRYYEPSDHGMEQRVKERLAHWKKILEESRTGNGSD
jgi:putative ATPase